MIPTPKLNQRWVSQAEPELGLGIIVEVTDALVKVWFRAAKERRQYALSTAPLRRVQLQVGDKVSLQQGAEIVVEKVSALGDFLFLSCKWSGLFGNRVGGWPELQQAGSTLAGGSGGRGRGL